MFVSGWKWLEFHYVTYFCKWADSPSALNTYVHYHSDISSNINQKTESMSRDAELAQK